MADITEYSIIKFPFNADYLLAKLEIGYFEDGFIRSITLHEQEHLFPYKLEYRGRRYGTREYFAFKHGYVNNELKSFYSTINIDDQLSVMLTNKLLLEEMDNFVPIAKNGFAHPEMYLANSNACEIFLSSRNVSS